MQNSTYCILLRLTSWQCRAHSVSHLRASHFRHYLGPRRPCLTQQVSVHLPRQYARRPVRDHQPRNPLVIIAEEPQLTHILDDEVLEWGTISMTVEITATPPFISPTTKGQLRLGLLY